MIELEAGTVSTHPHPQHYPQKNSASNGQQGGSGPHVIASDEDIDEYKPSRGRSKSSFKQKLPALVPLDHNSATPNQPSRSNNHKPQKARSTKPTPKSTGQPKKISTKKIAEISRSVSPPSRKKSSISKTQDADWLFGDEGNYNFA